MSYQYKLRVRCKSCHSTQMRGIAELAAGATCYLGRGINTPACNGQLEYYANDEQDSILNTGAMLGYLNQTLKLENPRLAELLDTTSEDIGLWMEGEQTPQQMGWVDSQGRP